MKPAARGICPACGEERALTSEGVMRYHLAPRDPSRYTRVRSGCDGSQQPPRQVVADPIVAAAARGYEHAIAVLRAEAEQLRKEDSSTMGGVFTVAADHLHHVREGQS